MELTSVGDEDLGIFKALGAVHADGLVEDKALIQVRVRQLSADLFDDLDVVQICRALRTAGLA